MVRWEVASGWILGFVVTQAPPVSTRFCGPHHFREHEYQSSNWKDVPLHKGHSAFLRGKDASSNLAWCTTMKQTLARIQFKKHFGQANHYLVTSLVALDNLDESPIVKAPEELRMAWSPKDKAASVIRSRNFVLHSFLGWAVDSIDMYLSLLNRKPNYLQNSALASRLDGAGRSVLRKAQIFSEHYNVHPATRALIDVLVTWRNNVFHELADNKIKKESREALVSNSQYIAENYRGLEVRELPNKAERGRSLTFKETASLINAVHHYVQEIDAAVLLTFDPIAFCTEAVRDAVNDKEQETGFAAKYLSLGEKDRQRFLRNWFMNSYGFSEMDEKVLTPCLAIQKTRDAG